MCSLLSSKINKIFKNLNDFISFKCLVPLIICNLHTKSHNIFVKIKKKFIETKI